MKGIDGISTMWRSRIPYVSHNKLNFEWENSIASAANSNPALNSGFSLCSKCRLNELLHSRKRKALYRARAAQQLWMVKKNSIHLSNAQQQQADGTTSSNIYQVAVV